MKKEFRDYLKEHGRTQLPAVLLEGGHERFVDGRAIAPGLSDRLDGGRLDVGQRQERRAQAY